MNVLIVGGAGYIGSHVAKEMHRAGHETVVFDNLSTGLRVNLRPDSVFRHGDILDSRSLDAVCSEFRFDGLVHLAARKAAGESMEKPEIYSTSNLVGSLNLIHAAIRHQIPRFVFSSSAAVYGEPQYQPVDEGHPKVPENYYGFTKLEIEKLLDWYGRLKGLKSACLRYFNAAGYDVDGDLAGLEQNPANLLPVVMETAMGWREKLLIFGDDYPTEDGTCIRDYVHVSDLARAHVLALEHLERSDESLTVNLGSEKGASVMEMVRAASRICGRELPHEIVGRRLGDPAKLVASSGLAKTLLGWEARHSDINTLLETTWRAYQANAAHTPTRA